MVYSFIVSKLNVKRIQKLIVLIHLCTGDEATMASYVQSTGPLSICVDADSWDSYTSGIMSTCPSRNIDHCVQAVGVATKDGYWKVRNSWGATWGEKGYIRIAYGKNNCGLNNDPTFVTGTKLL